MTIKNIRKQNGLLQKYVANQLGICARHYQRIENGEHQPSKKQIEILSKIFRCDMSKICDMKGDI